MSRAGDQSRLSYETCLAVFRWASTGEPFPPGARAEIRNYARSVGAPDPQLLMNGPRGVVDERDEWERQLDRHSKGAVDILRRLRALIKSGQRFENDDRLNRELGRWFALDDRIVADAKERRRQSKLERVK